MSGGIDVGALGANDLEALLDVALAAYSFESVDEFRAGLLPQLARLVPADTTSYNEVDVAGRQATVVLDPPDVASVAVEQAFAATAHQHPGIAAAARGDLRARRLSDFLSVRELHRLELYQEVYRPLGTEDQLYFCVPGPNVVGIVINRSRRSFGDRDRQVLKRLRPHLAQAYRQARSREHARALIAAHEAGLQHHDGAVIVLDASGSPVHISAQARRLLAAYFGEAPGGALPDPLTAWLSTKEPDRFTPLTVTTSRGRLHVSAVRGRTPQPWRAVLLDEQRIAAPTVDSLRTFGLTRRQAEVLRLLACGMTNQQIADEIFCSPATVRKHLEHIYARLRVRSRGQAIAVALSDGGSSAG